jgi:uncharacterized protein YjbJ (UPF0337 family)
MDERKNTLGEEIKATGERVKGATKDAFGAVTGNESLEREGEMENAEGRQRQAANSVMSPSTTGQSSSSSSYASDRNTLGEEVSATGQRATGAAKDAFGAVTGNQSLEREGELENAQGRSRQATNDVMSPSVTGSGRAASGYVTGIYKTPDEASRAYETLTTKHGYKADDVDVLMSDETRNKHFSGTKPGQELSSGTKAAEGFATGGAIGGGVGAALGALFAIGSNLVIPGLGLVVAGPIAAALAGAGAGGATGGLIGALVGAGIPEDRAREYDEGVRQGGIVIGTRARDDAHAAELERDYNTFGGSSVIR